ncbi:MAG TPA: phospholipid scramblase-related protein [Cytophagaceae bacterium]|jgi:uncharacterized protein YxjI
MFHKANYLIKEHVSFLKFSDTYDILDPQNGELVATARENISIFIKLIRLVIGKKLLPTKVEITNEATADVVYTMKKGFTILRSKVVVSGVNGEIGYFKSRVFTIGGRFDVFTPSHEKVAEVKGGWIGWTFKFIDNNKKELGSVEKKWAGIGKEFFTSADNYMISLNPELTSKPELMALLITAGLAIDVVYNEKK